MRTTSLPFTLPRSRPAFTLLEVLVVTGIVSLLVAILAPSLSRARQQTRATLCAGHLRQLSTGWQLYAEQWKEVIVAGRFPKIDAPSNPQANIYWVGNGWKYRARWFAMLGAQVGHYAYKHPSADPAEDNTQPVDGEIFLDPTVPERNNTRNYVYGYNFQFLGNSRTKVGGQPPDWINWPVKLADIRVPAETVMAADSLGTAASTPIAERLPYDPTGLKSNADPRRITEHGWSLDPPRLTEAGDFCNDELRPPKVPSPLARSAPDPRHLDRANFVFCDAHIERRYPRELGYVINADGTVPLMGEGTNRFFSGTRRDEDPPSIRVP